MTLSEKTAPLSSEEKLTNLIERTDLTPQKLTEQSDFQTLFKQVENPLPLLLETYASDTGKAVFEIIAENGLGRIGFQSNKTRHLYPQCFESNTALIEKEIIAPNLPLIKTNLLKYILEFINTCQKQDTTKKSTIDLNQIIDEFNNAITTCADHYNRISMINPSALSTQGNTDLVLKKAKKK